MSPHAEGLLGHGQPPELTRRTSPARPNKGVDMRDGPATRWGLPRILSKTLARKPSAGSMHKACWVLLVGTSSTELLPSLGSDVT